MRLPQSIVVLIMESINLHWQVIPLQTCDIHVWTVVFSKGEVCTVIVLSTKACGRRTSWPVQLYLDHFSATLNNSSIPAAPVAWSAWHLMQKEVV